MKILLVNANTSEVVTGKVLAGARDHASPGTELVAVTGRFGARVIASRAENAIAEHSLISLVCEHSPGFDAVVIAVSYDTALRAARELLSIPVVGMTEAGLLTACLLGGRIGVVSFGRHNLPMYQELVEQHGFAQRIAGWRVLESQAVYQPGAHEALDAEIVAAALDLIERDYAETVLLTGAVMAGVPARLQARVPVPLIDGVACAVRQAELLVRLGLPKASVGSYSAPRGREIVDVDPAVIRAFAAPDPAGPPAS